MRTSSFPLAGGAFVALAVSLSFACGEEVDPNPGRRPNDGTVPGNAIVKVGIRRLSQKEYRDTVRDLTGIDHEPKSLPIDDLVPFDNDQALQVPTQPLIDAIEAEANAITAKIMADQAVRDRLVGCTPKAADDRDCMTSFVTTFGRRALRRPLAQDEVADFVGLTDLATSANDFFVGVDAAFKAFFQHASFLYRIEIGEPVPDKPGVFRLNDFEVASRLSYFLWGSMPDDALLDAAEKGELGTVDKRRAAITRMMADPKARERVLRFHAMWLGYERMAQSPTVADAARRETNEVVSRVVFERHGSWNDLLRTDETFIDQNLATTYGIPWPGGEGFQWVKITDERRKGILGHVSFLSHGSKFGDTSPTLRGIAVKTRLLCEPRPQPPPNANVDDPPPAYEGKDCKHDRYLGIAATGCGGCHKPIDSIGFGLERWDNSGAYRETEKDRPECKFPEEGEIVGVGTFKGPAGLADVLAQSGGVEKCLTKQLYRFAMGHEVMPEDQNAVAELDTRFVEKEQHFDELVVELASSNWFGFRLQD